MVGKVGIKLMLGGFMGFSFWVVRAGESGDFPFCNNWLGFLHGGISFFGTGTGDFVTGWIFGVVLGKVGGRVSLIC